MNAQMFADAGSKSIEGRPSHPIVRRDTVPCAASARPARFRRWRWGTAIAVPLALAWAIVPTPMWATAKKQARRVPLVAGAETRVRHSASAIGSFFGFRPTFQTVVAADPELRAGQYAINLGINADWSTAGAWVDARNSFRRWGRPDRPWVEVPDLKLSADGYPLADAGTLSYLRGYPDGAYQLSYRGTGRITVGGMGQLAGPIATVDGRHSAVVAVNHATHDLFTLSITGIDPADPVRDLRLIRPGFAADTRRVFADPYLRRLRPFTTIRPMDWSGVNTAAVHDWSERVSPTSFLRTGVKGVAYEDLAALSNESGKNLWITLPDGASDDHAARLAKLLRERLDPKRRVFLELGNELWNGLFPQAKRMIAAARADAELERLDDFGRAGEKAGKRLGEIATIFRSEFGPNSDRVVPVLCGQSANPYFLECGLEYLSKHRGNPRETISAIAIAPYLFLPAGLDKPGLSADALFAGLDEFRRTNLEPWVRQHASLAAKYKLPLIAYEGGQHLTPWDPTDRMDVNVNVKREAQEDPRMGDLYLRFDRDWARNGGGMFTFYTLLSSYGQGGYWGLLADQALAGSTKWDAALAMSLPPGDATLDGKVDFEDFQVIAAHFGRKPAWREQGDLDRDGDVDTDDLKIFRQQAKELSATERQAVEDFATKVAGAEPSSVSKR